MLTDVVRYVAEDFVRSKCPAVVYFGTAFLAQNDSPNRVVFVQTQDNFGPNIFGGQNPRPIYTRNVGCEAHLWAAAPKQADASQQPNADQAVLDALVNQTVLSLTRAVSPPGISLNTGTQRYEAVVIAYGAAYVLQFTIQVPIVDIQFPDLGIDQDVYTWRVVDPVEQDVTVSLVEPA